MGLLMPRTDLARWRTARTLPDLGELTAQWLEGEIGSRPGYDPDCGPDEETAPLVPVLATACRAGFMTDVSQPAAADDGSGWVQRAAVSGFAGPALAHRLAAAAGLAGLIVIAGAPGRRPRRSDWVTVTTRDGRDCTRFGTLPCREVRSAVTGWGLCHKAAVDVLCGAWQLTIADPEWGRPELLWRTLAAVVLDRPSVPPTTVNALAAWTGGGTR